MLKAHGVINPLRMRLLSLLQQSSPVVAIHTKEIGCGGTALISLREYSNGWCEVEKQLLPKFQTRREFEDLQEREFRILSSLDHPHIVRAHRLESQRSRAGGETKVLILEALKGVSLSRLGNFLENLDANHREDFAQQVLGQCVAAVSDIQKKKIVHGDLCPENIVLTTSGRIKIIDFATSRYADEPAHSFQVMGKAAFRAPEARFSGATSLEADIFALGRIFEFLLGDELSQRFKNKTLIDEMQIHRRLPEVLRQAEISILPNFDDFVVPYTPRQKTRLEGELSLRTFVRAVSFPALLVVILFYQSSFLPQWASVQINSFPPSSFHIATPATPNRYDTPVRGMELPAGRWTVDFVVPTQKNRVIRKQILVLPGESLKIFEDFRNY